MPLRNFSYILLFSLFCGCTSEFEGDDNGDQLFLKFYGGAGTDLGNAVIQYREGYALVGSSTSFGGEDFDLFIVITDKNGNAIASKGMGGEGNQFGNSIIPYNDNLLAVGHTEDVSGNSDIWILEISPMGDSLRSWTFGQPDVNEQGVDLKAMANGNLVITATVFDDNGIPDTYVLKLNPEMETLWENKKALTHLADLFGKNIVEYRENEIVYCSTSKRSASGYTDMRLTAVNSIGEVSWNVYFGDSNNADEAHAVTEHYGAFYLLGNTSSGTDSDILVVRTNKAGNNATSFTLGSPGVSETGKQLVSLSDGGLLVVGERKEQGSSFSDIYIEKIDSEGNILWEHPYVLSGSLDDLAGDALETENGDLVFCGTASFSGNPMMLLVKMNKEGKLTR